MKRLKQLSGIAVAMAILLAGPVAASAQSQLDTAQAEAFLGNWTLSFQTDMGPFEMGLNITDADGKVAARMTAEVPEPTTVDITMISRSEESLVLTYEMDAQGQVVPVRLDLTPDGEQLTANMDFAGGQFMITGTGMRTDS